MKHLKVFITALLIAFVAASCTKVIDLKLGNAAGQLVIEGNLTNMFAPQYVTLSRNVAFTSTNAYPPVTGATVTISCANGSTYNLTEGPAGTYSVNPLQGIAGNIYTLTILTNGVTYTASSQMPALVPLDSVSSRNNQFGSSTNSREIVAYFTDPAGIPNQYRFVLYINGVQVKNIFAFNDTFTDGKQIQATLNENDINIMPGDTATVEMQCIDMNIYTYWFSLMQQNEPGSGITPSNPPTNITPAALGYFSAHSTQTKTIVVK